jgi:hypothetical protein
MMSRDLEGAVLRPDLPAFFIAGAPSLSFYTRQQGLVTDTNSGNRPLSRVAYSVTNTAAGSSLRRSSRGFNYGEDLSYSPTNWSVPTGGPAFDSDLGPGVLIVRQQFIGTNGLNILPEKLFAGWTNSGTNSGVGAVRAMTISLAVVDRDTLRLLMESGKLGQLQANFSTNDPGAIRSYAKAWQDQFDDPAAPFAAGGVPKRVLRGLRIFERTVSLPIYPE